MADDAQTLLSIEAAKRALLQQGGGESPVNAALERLGAAPASPPTLAPSPEPGVWHPPSSLTGVPVFSTNPDEKKFTPQGGNVDLSQVRTASPRAPEAPPVPDDTMLHPENWNKTDPQGAMAPPPMSTGPVRTVAGYVPVGRSMQVQEGFDPRELESSQMYRGFEMSDRNAAAVKRLEEAKIQADADILYKTRVEDANNWREQQKAALEAEKNAYVANKLNELDAASKQVAATKIDPGQFWEDHGGTFGKVVAAIAVGMGQYSASRVGGQNAALSIINDSINKNIAAQQANLENQRASLSDKTNLFKQNMAAFGDKALATEATRLNYLDLAKVQLDKTYAEAHKSAGLDAAYSEFNAGLEAERAKTKEHTEMLMHSTVGRNMSEQYRIAQIGGQQSGGPMDYSPKDAKELLERYIPDYNGFALSKEDKQKFIEKTALGRQVMENIRASATLKAKLLSMGTFSALDPSTALKYNEIARTIEGIDRKVAETLSSKNGQGIIRDEEREATMGMTGGGQSAYKDPARLRSDLGVAKRLYQRFGEDERGLAQSLGIQKGGVYFKPGKYGSYPVPYLRGTMENKTHATENYDSDIEPPKEKAK